MKKKIILYIGGGIAILIVGSLLFIRLVIIPADIRAECNEKAWDFVSKMAKGDSFYNREDRDADYKFRYQSCLRENGFENL